jgi:hypothetical protein
MGRGGAGDVASLCCRDECCRMTDTSAWRYSACGLVIESDAPIKGWQPATGNVRPDVTISLRDSTAPDPTNVEYGDVWYVSPEVTESGSPEMTIEAGPTGYRLTYGDDVMFAVSGTAGHISLRRAAAPASPDIAAYLSGSVLGFVLRVRGLVPLHASAVVVKAVHCSSLATRGRANRLSPRRSRCSAIRCYPMTLFAWTRPGSWRIRVTHE